MPSCARRVLNNSGEHVLKSKERSRLTPPVGRSEVIDRGQRFHTVDANTRELRTQAADGNLAASLLSRWCIEKPGIRLDGFRKVAARENDDGGPPQTIWSTERRNSVQIEELRFKLLRGVSREHDLSRCHVAGLSLRTLGSSADTGGARVCCQMAATAAATVPARDTAIAGRARALVRVQTCLHDPLYSSQHEMIWTRKKIVPYLLR